MKIDFTTNVFIFDILKLFKWVEEVGIFSSDTLPDELKKEKAFTIVCNLSKQNEEGTHFITIIRRNDILLYLDPLALYLELNNEIESFIKGCNVKTIMKLEKPVQHIDSWFCGYFTIFFALYFNPLAKTEKIIKFCNRDLEKNDCICLENIVSYISSLT